MQTFLPYPDFERSARALDIRRLGKQRVEVIQIVRALTRPGYGWANHPAVLMWKEYEPALGCYGLTCCRVWSEFGFADSCAETIAHDLQEAGFDPIPSQDQLARAGALPPWLGDEEFHRSHRSVLRSKLPDHYVPLFPDTPDGLPSRWPVRSESALEAERRKAERLLMLQQRTDARARTEEDRARRRRSRAAKRGWKTRKGNQG
jgi:Pyrimidine dimer DNA glycosylase